MKASERTKTGDPTPSARKAQRELDELLGGRAKAVKGLTPSAYAQSARDYQAGKASYWANPG